MSFPPRMLEDDDCRRARQSLSIRLDGELSEIAAARLEAHLRLCGDCAAFGARIVAIADAMRSASLVEPAEAIVMPRRPRSRRWVLSAGAASVAAFVVAVATTGLPGWGVGGVRSSSGSNAAQLSASYADQQRAKLVLQHAANPRTSPAPRFLARALRTAATGRAAAK
jgi:predicted anti-sigma-YlaC factor YlaD